MGPVTRLLASLSAALLTLAWTGRATAFHLEDTLRGGTRGNAIGGTFSADGWRVTGRTDRIWYAVPRLVSGSVQFTLANVTMASLGDTSDNELFAMYEAGYGIAEPLRYAPEFRENNYKCMLRVYANGEGARAGQQKLMWGMCPGGAPGYGACSCGRSFFEEPFGGNGTWDGSPQRLRIEWGGGRTRYLRNGVEVLSIDWSSSGVTFGPSELHLSLGTSRPSAVDTAQLPVGALFSDLIVDGTEGALATCPGVTAPTDAGMMTSGSVVTVPAIEDVTVDPAHATTVYPDVNDLAVGAGDSEFYVKFRVGRLAGRVVRAQLVLNSAMNPSAVGTGASLYTAADASWSETSLTWNARPGRAGARLARVDGISVNEPYVFELPVSAVTGEGTWAFAVLPEPTDSNAAHFDSKEVSPARGPTLRLTIDPTMPPLDAGAPPPDVIAQPDATPPDITATDVIAQSDASAVDVTTQPDASSDVGAVTDVARDVAARETGPDEAYVEPPASGCGCRASRARPSLGGALALMLFARARRRQRRR